MGDPRSSPWSSFGPSVSPGARDPFTSDASSEDLDFHAASNRPRTGWLGWRLRLLVVATLAGCIGLLVFIRLVAAVPVLPLVPRLDASRNVVLKTPGEEARIVVGAQSAGGAPLAIEPLLFERSARWIVDDVRRLQFEVQHDAFAAALAAGPITWTLRDGSTVDTRAEPLGAMRLGMMFWLMTALALALYLVVAVIVMARPTLKNVLYAMAALPQAANLLFIASESAISIHLPQGLPHADHSVRMVLDVITAAAIAHVASLHPRPLPWARWLPAVVWAISMPVAVVTATLHMPLAWWVIQGACVALGAVTLIQFTWSYRAEPHPLTLIFKRFGLVTWLVFVVLTGAVGATGLSGREGDEVGAVGAVIWVIFLASTLLATPFMSRSQPMIREFSMLAGVSTIATALDLLFVAVFSLSSFSALTLALFLALMVYAGVRQWILNHMLQANVLTTERMFEHLYRIARDVEAHPNRLADHFSSLLRELYDPLEVMPAEVRPSRSHVAKAGAELVVPMPNVGGDAPAAPRAVALRYAHRGKRLFTPEDARLTDRVIEQLARVVAFDQAVEKGRTEERVRIAQDLHDDIGARLLTLMYKAQNSEVEDYIRHTLHELKTLTRGLAAKEHRLSHAVGEWKADIANRLTVARCELDWSFTYDDDVLLTVVQWSALTRILRELVNNVIAHGKAGRVWLDARLVEGHLRIRVADDGVGRAPHQWHAGLGLGGVRKRVKQLAGHVRWEENSGGGIVCVVDLRLDVAPG
jgi:signal transduction histidine kinase